MNREIVFLGVDDWLFLRYNIRVSCKIFRKGDLKYEL